MIILVIEYKLKFESEIISWILYPFELDDNIGNIRHFCLSIFIIVVFLMFIILVLKVFYIQVFDYNKLSNLSSDLWSRNLPIEADRGKIYDRNGILLADNVTTTSLVLIPNQIKNKE